MFRIIELKNAVIVRIVRIPSFCETHLACRMLHGSATVCRRSMGSYIPSATRDLWKGTSQRKKQRGTPTRARSGEIRDFRGPLARRCEHEELSPTIETPLTVIEQDQTRPNESISTSTHKELFIMRDEIERSIRKSPTQTDEIIPTRGKDIQPHHVFIRSCLSSTFSQDPSKNISTGMHIAFLGTGAGHPTALRNASATAVRFGGMTYLFDVGEGFQRQMEFSTLSMSEISKIFITHLHGDHIFGLPALLLHLQNIRKSQKASMQLCGNSGTTTKNKMNTDKPVEIYGPAGLYNYVVMNLILSCSKFDTLNVIVHELTGGKAQLGPRHSQQPKMKNPFTGHYPEMANSLRNVVQNQIPMQPNGTWVIERPLTITEDMVWHRHEWATRKQSGKWIGRAPPLPNEPNAGSNKQMTIQAAEVTHVPGIQTFGYVLEELPPPPTIDPKKAMELGLAPSPKYLILKNGFPVKSDDGTRAIYPEQVLLPSQKRGRKFALLGDNSSVSYPMAQLCKNADLLVHEATFASSEEYDPTRGHATAEMAGRFARDVKAKVLVMNHFGGGGTADSLDEATAEATEGNGGTSRIVASYDFMEIIVPRGGFDFSGGES